MRRARARPVPAFFFPNRCAAVQEQDLRFTAPRTHSCSHYNAIRIPALQNTKGELITRWNDPNHNRGTQEVPFIAACSHFARKNTRFRAPASSPKHTPCNMNAAITMRVAAPRTHPCSPYNAIRIPALQNMATKHDSNHAVSFPGLHFPSSSLP